VRGAGNGAPKPNVPDQVGTTGPGSGIEPPGGGGEVVHTLAVDTTVVRPCSENRHVDLERVDNTVGPPLARWPRHIPGTSPGQDHEARLEYYSSPNGAA
jgi:hypothetical protein